MPRKFSATDESRRCYDEAYLLKRKWKKLKGEGKFCWTHADAGAGLYDLPGAVRIQKDMEVHSAKA
jgi:hypothetical protein